MGTSEVCVAAIDLQRLQIVRPLQWNHHNWPIDLIDAGLQPGRLIHGTIRLGQNGHGYPHQTEDLQLSDTFVMLDALPESNLFSCLAPLIDASIDDIFAGNVEDGVYVIDGTICRSLGSLLIDARTADIYSRDFLRLRLSFSDAKRQYDLPITEFRAAKFGEGMVAAIQRLESAKKSASKIHVRIGLARGFDGNGKWEKKRCYLQVNGMIFPS